MHRLLHLQKHTHTAKIIPHHHTSYRSLVVIVAVFCIALTGIQHAAVSADEIVISAKVAAPIPSQPAVITSPANGSVNNTPSVLVSGTCQITSPAIIITITSNGELRGSTTCNNDGTFNLPITLRPGENQLIARSVNSTGDYGPDSAPIFTTYVPVSPPPTNVSDGITPTNDTPNTGEQGTISALKILSKYSFLTYGPGKPAMWTGTFEGGRAPYFVSVEWGDGLTNTYQDVLGTEQLFEHRYKTYETFFITVTVTDVDSRSLSQQIAAVTPYIPVTGSTTTTGESGFAIDERSLTLLIYISLVVLIGLGVLAWSSVHTIAVAGHKTPHVRQGRRNRT